MSLKLLKESLAVLERQDLPLQVLSNQYEAILDAIPALIFYKDMENRFVWVNIECASCIGLPKTDIIGKSCYDLFPKEDADHYWSNDQDVINSGEPKLGILETMTTADGSIGWYLTHKLPYITEDGEVTGVIGFSVDVSLLFPKDEPQPAEGSAE